MEQHYGLAQHGKQLWTRELARKIRAQITGVLDKLAAGDVLVIDMHGVEVFDFSFANELFGKLLLALPQDYTGRFIVIEHLTDYTRENLIKALESLNLVAIERKRGKLEILGNLHPVDAQTFNAIVQAKGPMTAVELKNKLNVNLNAMNERLNKLTGLGLIRRDKGVSAAGREHFEYRAVS
jgi:predicted transcriptional regulator